MRAHYYCHERVCLDLKFVVFETEIEYKAHLAEMHMGGGGGGRMQRSAQNQLRRIDSSFVFETVGASRSNVARGPISVAATATLSQPQPPRPTPPPASVVVSKDLLFNGGPESMGALLGRLESLSLYEENNREVIAHLRNQAGLSEAQVTKVRQVCSEYQRDRIGIVEMFTRQSRLLSSPDLIRQVFERLISLQLDPRKRTEMTAQLTGYLNRLAAFPTLPEGGSGDGVGESIPVVRRPGPVKGGNRILTIGPKPAHPHSVFISRTGPLMGSDPAKNPLSLIRGTTLTAATLTKSSTPKRVDDAAVSDARSPKGSSSGKAKKGLVAATSASFHQALQVGPSSCAPIRSGTGGSGSALYELDDQQYPTLGGPSDASRTTAIGAAQVQSNIFSRSRDHSGPDTFVMGHQAVPPPPPPPPNDDDDGEEEETLQDTLEPPPATTAAKKKRSKKGRVVLQCAHPTL